MLSQTFRFERDRLRRRRFRFTFLRWKIEASIGIVPNRIMLRRTESDHDDPDWDPTFQPETLYSRVKIRTRDKQAA